jgi:solute carrier family 13 (sodium-dependent dicarboxylate transporter), member 2/3/5
LGYTGDSHKRKTYGIGVAMDIKKISLFCICILLMIAAYTIPAPANLSPEGFKMLFITLIAFVLWVFELMPIQLTALIIIFLEFSFGVVPFTSAIQNFAHPVGLLLFAGFSLSAGIQKCKIDTFIIGKIITYGGKDTRKLLLLLMGVVSFLSMWISNTATCAIMMPFTVAVVNSIENEHKNIGKIYAIGIAYAATIGGVGTPIGTTTNPIVIASVREMLGINISFVTWLGIGFPFVVLLVPLGWFLLIRIFPPEIKEFTKDFKISEYNSSIHNGRSIRMLVIFILLIILWFSEIFFKNAPDNWIYMTSFFIAIVLYLPYIGVLDWEDAKKHVDVGIIVIVAGGIALGKGLLFTGTITWILDSIIPSLQQMPLFMINAILAMLTGLGVLFFCGITATASTFVPLAIILALNLGYNPVIFAAIAGIASTFAFLLPASTAPNAIAFSTGYYHTKDMLKVGIPMLILSIFVVIIISSLIWPLFL